MLKVIDNKNDKFCTRTRDYINVLKDICDFRLEEDRFGAIGFGLIRIGDIPYYEEFVVTALEKAILTSKEYSPTSITDAFINIYPSLVQPKTLEQEIEEALKEEQEEIWYQFSTFATHTFPQNKTEINELVTEYPNNKLSIESVKGIPYGGVARLIVLYINSMAVKYRSREISIGKSIKEFVENLGYKPNYKEGKINEQVLQQLEKLFHTTFVLTQTKKTQSADDMHTIQTEDFRFHLFDSKFTLEQVKSNLNEKAVASVVLSEAYYREILAHPVPLSLETIKALKKSPLALDLYAFISYRANANRVIPAKLTELKKQFAFKGETWKFKDDLQRTLKYIKKAWPECTAVLKKDVLVIPKMQPHISHQTKK